MGLVREAIMTPTELRKSFGPYFRCLADRMGLRDWTTSVIAERAPEDADDAASVYCVPGRKLANITLGEWFLNAPEAEQRQYAVHELIHAHFAQAQDIADEGLEGLARFAWRRAHEYGVDALAEVLAPTMPLPSEVRRNPKK